ncbi:sigma-54-dependent transcriptional regulator [Deferribacteres bacterium DY0037]
MSEYNYRDVSEMSGEMIVIVDDEPVITKSYEIYLRKVGYKQYRLYNDPLMLMDEIHSLMPAVIFLDLRMPGMDGEQLLEEVTGMFRNASVFIVSGTEDVETAVRCIKNGALDYLVKPINKERFQTAIIKGLEIYRIKNELVSVKEKLSGGSAVNPAFKSIITRSSLMERVQRYVEAVASGDAPVLVTGETGTGKELIAEAVHKCSGRKGELIPVNVSALDENMFNDTLFGHKKGAFTGADKDRAGLLASADMGTVFLDEIGDLSDQTQVKLLRVLQNNEYLPVGSDKPRKTTARIIAATNADLKQKVSDGAFRQDLYYRLAAHTIKIPPLRDRREDIELLLHYFYEKHLLGFSLEPECVPLGLIEALKKHDFPGNVRELEAVVADYVIMFKNTCVTTAELKQFLQEHHIKVSRLKSERYNTAFEYSGEFPTFKEMEMRLIKEALRRTDGNQSRAASLLGISRQALNKRLNS